MENNYAFIDSQNVNLGIRELGWRLDFARFKIYLKDKYDVSQAYLFLGQIPGNERLYKALEGFGYHLIFKPTIRVDGIIKGNCDAELVLQVMIEYANYEKAIIVTGDGDFTCLVKYLYQQDKLAYLLAPNPHSCSGFLRRSAREKLIWMDNLKYKIGLK